MYQFPNSRMHLLFKKNLCGTRSRAFVFERLITTASQPSQGFKTERDVTFLALPRAYPLTWTSGRISRNMRRNQRWNFRDSVEERNPMLLLGRPLGTSAARVGGLLSTGQVGAHGSAAAAVSCRGTFLSFSFPLDFDFATGKQGAAGLFLLPDRG